MAYLFEGSATAMVTPFNEDGTVNYTALDEMIELANGVEVSYTK